MAKDKKNRLAEIYKAEKKKGGGVFSTLGKRGLEKFDPRQIFNQTGFLAAVLPSLFKAYTVPTASSLAPVNPLEPSAIKENLKAKESTKPSPLIDKKLDVLINETSDLKTHAKISAKNSLVLPYLARDMNVTRINIQKLVKLMGGTASKGSDAFFKRAGEREALYESQFKREKSSQIMPGTTPVKKEETGGLFGGIFSLLGKGISGAGSLLTGLLPSLSGFFGTLIKAIIGAGIFGLIFKNLDEDTKQKIRDFLKDMLIGAFNAIESGFKELKTLLTDSEVIKSLQSAVKSMIDAVVESFKVALGTEIETPLGKFSLGSILEATVGALVAFKIALGAAATALGATMIPGKTTTVPPGTPGSSPKPGTPSTVPPGTAAAGAGGAAAAAAAGAAGASKVVQPAKSLPLPSGMAQTSSGLIIPEKVKADLEKKALQQTTKIGAQTILRSFLSGAGQLISGPIGTAWLAAYTAYQVIDALAPNQQEAVNDSLASLIVIQDRIDEIQKGSGSEKSKKKAIDYQLGLAKKEEEKLKFFGVNVSLEKTPELTTPTPAAPTPALQTTATQASVRAVDNATVQSTTPEPATKSTAPTSNVKSLNDEQKKMASLIIDKFKQAGFNDEQANAAVINAYAESRLNPTAKNITSKEESYGLFQMNTKGGLGTGHDPKNLMDPNYNIKLAIDAAKKSPKFISATNLDDAIRAFTTEVERPANMLTEAEKRVQIASSIIGTPSTTPQTLAALNTTISATPLPDTMKTIIKSEASKLNAATVEIAQARLQIGNAPIIVSPPAVNVQAPQIQAGGGGGMLAASSVVDTEFMKLLVGRTVTI